MVIIKIINARIFTENGDFLPGSMEIENGRFGRIEYAGDAPRGAAKPQVSGDVVDAGGCYAIPGLIDIHLHGCAGYKFYETTLEGMHKMLEYQAANGVTAVTPTTLTLPGDELERACEVVAEAAELIGGDAKKYANEAAPVGVYLEGPFLSPAKSGAQNPAYAIPFDIDLYNRLRKASKNLVKIIAIAPELEGAPEFIDAVKGEAVVAIAHTVADYAATVAAFKRGASHVTHLYNAMSPFSHREPNVIGATFDTPGVTAELICDGVHLHPAAVRIAVRLLGADRAVLVSDSMTATGLGDGDYELGGLSVRVAGKEARLVKGGNIASSVSNLMDCLRVAVKDVGVPLGDAVRCASSNPARVLRLENERGNIREGLIADIVLLDAELNTAKIYVRGRPIL